MQAAPTIQVSLTAKQCEILRLSAGLMIDYCTEVAGQETEDIAKAMLEDREECKRLITVLYGAECRLDR